MNNLFHRTEMTMCVIMLTIRISILMTWTFKKVITRLKHDAALAIGLFESNYVMLNQDKCHFLFSGHKYQTLFVYVGEAKISESKQQELLHIFIDRDLKFDEYVLSQCKNSR